jgi:signal peptidase II
MTGIAAYKRLHILALAILVADQITKLIIERALPYGSFYPPDNIVIIPGLFNLVHVGNTGAAWSLFSGYPKALAALGVVALLLLYFFRNALELKLPQSQWSFGLIIGGILGNLIDRFRLGHVTDFLDFHAVGWHFPSFNIADSAITIGVGLHILFAFRQSKAETASDTGS